MDLPDTTGRAAPPPRASQLEELLACEQDLARLLEEARAEARRLVESALAETAAAAADLEASLEDARDRERARIRADAQRRIHELAADARERAGRFERVPDDGVDVLARSAFRRLLGGEAAP